MCHDVHYRGLCTVYAMPGQEFLSNDSAASKVLRWIAPSAGSTALIEYTGLLCGGSAEAFARDLEAKKSVLLLPSTM